MQLAAPQGGHGLVDGLAAQVVAERLAPVDVHEQPGSQALVHGGGVAVADGLEQLGGDRPAEHGRGVEGVAGGAAERDRAGEHDLADGGGHGARLGVEHLHEEERVAARAGVQRGDVERPVAHQRARPPRRTAAAGAPGSRAAPPAIPRARRIGWSGARSSRWVTRTRHDRSSRRRATKRRRSRVASSAHCRSSSTTTLGCGGDATSARNASKIDACERRWRARRRARRAGCGRCRPRARGAGARTGRRTGRPAPARRPGAGRAGSARARTCRRPPRR